MFLELVWSIPFILLLASIAIFPLTAKHWWEKNYPLVCLAFGSIIIVRYLLFLHEGHVLIHTAHEYVSFICLIGALFVVAGGIHIQVKGESKPWINCVFLMIGAVLANVIGTTGASMIMIRPWIRMNKYRITAHHIVFFIFIVSNIGGALTPIGDPPLFLGYLKGIPFWWVLEHQWTLWLAVLIPVLTIFFVLDEINFRKAPKTVRETETSHEEWRFTGLHNLLFLLLILGAVFIKDPPFLREILMVVAAILSYKTTPKQVHESNDFQFGPIKEVAILFLGIFSTMIPALQWLEHHAQAVGIQSALQFYWGSGILSSVLDNAPTYLNFLSAAMGLFTSPEHAHEAQIAFLLAAHTDHIRAISAASVIFGAVTYIGNGPNFLVKSIADQQKVHTPSFFGYFFRYSLPYLIPVFTVVGFIFFRS